MKQEYNLILKIMFQNKALFVAFFIINIVQGGFAVLFPYFSKLQVDQLESKNPDFFSGISASPEIIFAGIVVIAALTIILENIFDIISDIVKERASFVGSMKTEKELYDHIEKFDASFMQNPRNRRIVNSSLDLIFMVYRFFVLVSQQSKALIGLVIILPIVAYYDPAVFGILLVGSMVQLAIRQIWIKKHVLFNFARERQDSKFWQLQNLIFYELHNIKNTDSSDFIMKKYWDLRREKYRLEIEAVKLYGKTTLTEIMIQNVTYVIVALIVGFQVIAGVQTIGSFVMLVQYVAYLKGSFADISSAMSDFTMISIQFQKLGFFMNLKPRINLDRTRKIKGPISGDVVVRDVNFRYPSFYKEEREYIRSIIKKEEKLKKINVVMWQFADDLANWKEIFSKSPRAMPLVLKKVSCIFRKGEITALVGRNGSGKTTLINLITKNYDPVSGKMRIGEHDVANIRPDFLKKHVSVIPQEPFLLESFSIRDNIAFGERSRSVEKRIWELLEVFGIDETIRKLPRKLDTIVGDEVQFSQGQKQLLSVVRVLIQDRPIIIFDEGTNQLDAEHEAMLMNVLNEHKRDKVVIIITHKMTTVRKADSIYVIDKGIISEHGTHKELLEQKESLYRKFWDLQVVD